MRCRTSPEARVERRHRARRSTSGGNRVQRRRGARSEENDVRGTPGTRDVEGRRDVVGVPPDGSTVFSCPWATNPTMDESGDQNGDPAPSVPGSDIAVRESSDRTQSSGYFLPGRRPRKRHGARWEKEQTGRSRRVGRRPGTGVPRAGESTCDTRSVAAGVRPRRIVIAITSVDRASTAIAAIHSRSRGARRDAGSSDRTERATSCDPLQFARKVASVLPAFVGVFGEAGRDSPVERSGRWPSHRHRRRLRTHDRCDHRCVAVTGKCRSCVTRF